MYPDHVTLSGLTLCVDGQSDPWSAVTSDLIRLRVSDRGSVFSKVVVGVVLSDWVQTFRVHVLVWSVFSYFYRGSEKVRFDYEGQPMLSTVTPVLNSLRILSRSVPL